MSLLCQEFMLRKQCSVLFGVILTYPAIHYCMNTLYVLVWGSVLMKDCVTIITEIKQKLTTDYPENILLP